jgi:hypothetical protein
VGGNFGSWFVYIAQPVKANIWNGNAGLFWVYSCVREIGSFAKVLKEGVNGWIWEAPRKVANLFPTRH